GSPGATATGRTLGTLCKPRLGAPSSAAGRRRGLFVFVAVVAVCRAARAADQQRSDPQGKVTVDSMLDTGIGASRSGATSLGAVCSTSFLCFGFGTRRHVAGLWPGRATRLA